MRIVFLCTSGLDNASPHGRWLPIARELKQLGHEPHLLLLHPTFDKLDIYNFIADGVPITYVAQMHVYGLPGQRRHFTPLQLIFVSLQIVWALTKHAIRLRPEAIHVCKPQPMNGLAGLAASWWLHIPLYVDCDDYEAEANRFGGVWQRWVVKWWEDRLPRWAQGVTVNTRFMYERCLMLGVDRKRIRYVPNGISASQCQRPPEILIQNLREALGLQDKPTVIYLGTMSKVAHGVGLLLEAFALMCSRIPDVRLLMVGDGDDRKALETQAQQLGISDNIHWVGRVAPEETQLYLSLASCSVDPVYNTPAARGRSPLKIVESLAMGVPVVTGDVGDRREMLADGQAGVIVKAGDASALANGIRSVLEDCAYRERLVQAARVRAEEYWWEWLVREWGECIKDS